MSYIPRSSLMNAEAQSAIPMQVKRRHTVRMFNVITTILLVVSLIGTVGVFLYKDYIDGQLEAARVALDKVGNSRGGDNAKKIEEIRVYDNKLTIARSLVENHLSPSALLKELEDSTKDTVQFTSFEYIYDPGYEVILTLGGTTKEISSVALQKMQILRDGIFSEFSMSDITTPGAIGALTQGGQASTIGAGVMKEPQVEFQVKGVFMKKFLEYTGMADVVNTPVAEPLIGDVPPAIPETSIDTNMTNDALTPGNI